ncbi:hypothetical protein ACFVTY_01885 [Streptomyces sp. NPDC058067]|uniref:hypothetical protein n=1 Tax=Streptomyces sp. NPDC058067 TaxID=3346324 RepID=UPI0036EB3D6B
MSVINRARSLGKHRGKTPAQLRDALTAAEGREIGLTAVLDQLAATNTDLERQLDEAGIDLSGALDDLRAAKQTIRHLDAIVLLRDREIDRLNDRGRVGYLAETAATKTQPIPLYRAPFAATDPAHIPAITT